MTNYPAPRIFAYMSREQDVVRVVEQLITDCGSLTNAALRLGVSTSYLCDIRKRRRDASDRVLALLGLRRIIVKAA